MRLCAIVCISLEKLVEFAALENFLWNRAQRFLHLSNRNVAILREKSKLQLEQKIEQEVFGKDNLLFTMNSDSMFNSMSRTWNRSLFDSDPDR